MADARSAFAPRPAPARDAKSDIDRRHLQQGDQRCAIVPNHAASLYHRRARTPRDRSNHVGKAQLQLGSCQARLVGLSCRGCSVNGCLVGMKTRACCIARRHQLADPLARYHSQLPELHRSLCLGLALPSRGGISRHDGALFGRLMLQHISIDV